MMMTERFKKGNPTLKKCMLFACDNSLQVSRLVAKLMYMLTDEKSWKMPELCPYFQTNGAQKPMQNVSRRALCRRSLIK